MTYLARTARETPHTPSSLIAERYFKSVAIGSTIRRPGPTLTIPELREKTMWIRDVLEPNIARHGPRYLAPDTVLDLNSFFGLLLTDTTREYFSIVTRDAVEASRIHRALLLITGRGTRWPGKLIEVCDDLVAEWTARFGRLEMIRPILYERGGRLEMIKEERDMGRHIAWRRLGPALFDGEAAWRQERAELIMKWMSDPNSLVSPLRALEYGHLEFKPGQWWIHPLFAFHSGIIDSPDPHGGISADGDGAYAVLLTAYDEVSSETPDAFTYRCRNDDRGRFRLIGSQLPPKTSVRVLRSHTLHSVWSPPAGVRYDGLWPPNRYKVTKWSFRMVGNASVFDVTLQRDSDQLPMREVRLHPTAEEVDDYLEYKRLREEHREMLESTRRVTLTEKELLVDFADAEAEEDSRAGSETMLSSRKTRKFSDEPSPFTASTTVTSPFHGGLTPVRSGPRHGSLDTIRPLACASSANTATSGADLDGSSSSLRLSISLSDKDKSPTNSCRSSRRSSLTQSKFSVSSRASDAIQEIAEYKRGEELKARVDSAYEPVFDSKSPSKYTFVAALDGSYDLQGRMASLDHTNLESLAQKVNNLRAVTLKKDAVGSAFLEDLKGMQNIVERWRRESEELTGYVDTTLTRLEEDIEVMKEHGMWKQKGHSRNREDSRTDEPEKLEEYQKRYRKREREGSEVNQEWFEVESMEGGEDERVEEAEGQGVQAEGHTGGKWVIGDQVCWN